MKVIIAIVLITSILSALAWSFYQIDIKTPNLEVTVKAIVEVSSKEKTAAPLIVSTAVQEGISADVAKLIQRHDQYETKHQIAQHEVTENDDYYHYEYRTLWSLAEQGDKKAILYLKERLNRFEEEAKEDLFDGLTDLEELDHLDNEQIDLAYLDLIAGNPMAVFSLALRTSEGDPDSQDEYEQYRYFRHFATWSEIGVLMGSNLALYLGISSLNRKAEHNAFKFTETELNYISYEAKRMLSELEQQRMDLGWGPYPDAEEMRDNYHVLLKDDIAKLQSLTDWGKRYIR